MSPDYEALKKKKISPYFVILVKNKIFVLVSFNSNQAIF